MAQKLRTFFGKHFLGEAQKPTGGNFSNRLWALAGDLSQNSAPKHQKINEQSGLLEVFLEDENPGILCLTEHSIKYFEIENFVFEN